jgi:DNA-directed RNA polymerase subunit alpha
LEIKKKGEGKITAKDIAANSEVEIVNKDLPIATLTDEKADFNLEIFVDKGIGYVPTEVRDKEKLETGTIAIDALYSPVQNVGIKVENVRVGQMTNYDKLILDLSTDGTITAEEAFYQAVKILMNHFKFLESGGESAELAQPESVLEKASGEEVAVDSLKAVKDESEKQAEATKEEPAPKKRGRPRKIKN